MSEQEFTIQVAGHLPSTVLDHLATVDGGYVVETVLSAAARDQAAVNGLLHRLEDLGVALVAFERQWPPSRSGPGLDIEIVVAGAVGDLVVSVLEEQVQVTRLASRVDLPGAVLQETLAILRDEGVEVEGRTTRSRDRHSPDSQPPAR